MLGFFESAMALKRTARQGWIDRLSVRNPESVADHTFGMAVIGMAVADEEGYDTERVLRMILLHDIAESRTGDLVPGAVPDGEKKRLQDGAMAELLGMLSEPLRDKYDKVWQEFCRQETAESRLVHQIDKLEMALQAKRYEGDGFSPEQLEPFYETAREHIRHPKIREIFGELFRKRDV